MIKQHEEVIELSDTINDTPLSIYDNNTPKFLFINSKIINTTEDNANLNNFPNKEKDNKNKVENKILLQRENRRIISLVKKIIAKKEQQNTTKLLIKNMLINHKKDITLLKDDKKNTLLHIYVEESDANSVNIILEIYLEILKISKSFYDFLFSKNIDDKNVFDISVQKGDSLIIKTLYEQIEKENNHLEKNIYMKYFKNNIFHISANYNQIFPIIFFYEKLRNFYKYDNSELILDTHEPNKDQMTPIHYACKNRNVKLMNLFIDLGANINSQDIKGNTPLHYAVINNDERMVKHLLIRGADKFIKNENNLIPYNLAFLLGDKNLVKILYHKNFCKRQFCGEEIGPLSKTNNMYILFIGLIFTIFIKIIIILRFYIVMNNIKIVDVEHSFFLGNNNNSLNNKTKSLNINDFFYCLDKNCGIEVGILFFSLIIDLLLLFAFILFKCSKDIFLEQNIESDDNILSSLYEKNENICVKCRIIINEKTQHCLICDRCVENWDHHCFWLNTCINDKNYTKFKFFISLAISFLFINLIFYITSVYLLFSSKDLFVQEIFKLKNGSLLQKIIIISIIFIYLYLILIMSYSLIFVAIPIIRYILSKYIKNKKKKNMIEKELDYKPIKLLKEDDEEENKININTTSKKI